MNEIETNELQLVITKKELGSLTTNAQIIKEKIIAMLPKYQSENYNANNIDEAKKDKALLNNTSKLLNAERIKLEKEFMTPFDSFKSEVKQICDLINDASSKIDAVVKQQEQKEKNERKAIITEIFNNNVKELKELLTLDKIFDDKWLNKGNWREDNTFRLENDLIAKIEVIRQDLITISELNSPYEVELKNDYLNHFQLGEVIRKNNDLIKKEELLKKQKEESEKVIEEKKEEQVQEMLTKEVKQEDIDPIKTYTLKITGPLSKQKALKQFLDLNNMKYEKI